MHHFNLLVGSLPIHKTEQEVLAFLGAPSGAVDLILKQGSEGEHYCLVEALTEDVYQMLLAQNGRNWEDATLEIRPPLYQPPVERTLHAKRIPATMSDEEVRSLFERFGALERLKVVRKLEHAFAFVTFRGVEARERCLADCQNMPLGNIRLHLQGVSPPAPPPDWSIDQFQQECDDLARSVESDINFKDLEARFRTLHSVRHSLFGRGTIGLTDARSIESRLQQLWLTKESRLRRAHEEFESDLISVEQNLAVLADEDAPLEAFARLAEEIRGVESYLQSLGLPTDRERYFEKRIESFETLFTKRWLDRISPGLKRIEERLCLLEAEESTVGYEALRARYQKLGTLRTEHTEFTAVFHNPPVRSMSRSARYQKVNSHQQDLWERRQQCQTKALEDLRSESSQMVGTALREFFEELGNPQATLRERANTLDEVESLLSELKVRVEADTFQRFKEGKATLLSDIRNAREELIERVETLVAECGNHPDPEALLDEIRHLHREQRTIPLPGRVVTRIFEDLRDVWEKVSRQVAEKHRIASEHLSSAVTALKADIDHERPDRLFPRLRNLSERVKQSRLSNRWKAILENQLSDLYEAIDARRNRDHQAAQEIVSSIDTLVESGATMAEVREALRVGQRQFDTLVLNRPLREELAQRLAQVQEMFEVANERTAQLLEPQVAACEELARQLRFDRVFAEINRLQQEINRAGATPRLADFRKRLNFIWQSAQESQRESANLLESLLDDRIGACEALAAAEPDFKEVRDALAEADRRFRGRPAGLRLSQPVSVYQERLDAAFEALRARERQAGEQTRKEIEQRAAAIRRQLQEGSSLNTVFQSLQGLSEYKRCHWKNQEDMAAFDALLDQLWSEARRVASEKQNAVIETARLALEHSTLLAARSFDWRRIYEELKNTGRLMHTLPLGRDLRDKLLEHLDMQFDHVKLRRRADENEEFSREWLTHRRAYCIDRGMVSILNQRWPTEAIGMQELSERELFVLTHIYDIVPRYSTDSEGNAFAGIEYDERSLDWVRIKKYRLPAIWYQPFTSVQIDFPVAYPHTPPIGWYMDDKLNLRGWREAAHYFPNRAYHGATARTGMAWYCCTVEQAGGRGGWRPSTMNNPRHRDNLWSFLDIIRTALSADD